MRQKIESTSQLGTFSHHLKSAGNAALPVCVLNLKNKTIHHLSILQKKKIYRLTYEKYTADTRWLVIIKIEQQQEVNVGFVCFKMYPFQAFRNQEGVGDTAAMPDHPHRSALQFWSQ